MVRDLEQEDEKFLFRNSLDTKFGYHQEVFS